MSREVLFNIDSIIRIGHFNSNCPSCRSPLVKIDVILDTYICKRYDPANKKNEVTVNSLHCSRCHNFFITEESLKTIKPTDIINLLNISNPKAGKTKVMNLTEIKRSKNPTKDVGDYSHDKYGIHLEPDYEKGVGGRS